MREEGSEILVAAGGDGTVGAAVDAIVRLDPSERPALALFPFGTANNIARSLGLMSGRRGGARAIRCAIEAALSGRERRIDLGRVGERYFLGSFALGIDADILAVRNHYTRRFFGSKLVRGYPLYLWSTAQCLTTARATAARVCIDGRARELDVYNLLVTNTSVYAGEFRFHAGDPSADALLDLHLFDGAFDYVTRYAAAWLRHLRHERGAPVASPPKLDSAACIEVELERPVRAQLDGEEIGQLNTCTLAVAAESLTVRVP